MLRPRFKDPIKAARAKGCSMGRHGISRLIGPAYRTTAEWLAFYAGWKRGDAEYQRLVIEARKWATVRTERRRRAA